MLSAVVKTEFCEITIIDICVTIKHTYMRVIITQI